MRSRDLVFLAAVTTLAAAACGGSDASPTAPSTPTVPTTTVATITRAACGSSTPFQISTLAGVTLDCSSANSVQLAPGSATYLVVPQFVTDDASLNAVSYTIAASGGVSQSVAPVSAPGLAEGAGGPLFAKATPSVNERQRAFDRQLRAAERAALASGAWRPSAVRALAERALADRAPRLVALPDPNSVRDFRVEGRTRFQTVSARLAYTGANVLVYVDTLAPPNGFSADQITAFGRLFDQTLYTIDLNAFGQPSDIDGNGRLIMLLTPVVNAIVTAAECRTGGYVAGFFDGIDLASTSTNSNHGEVFYGLVPDPLGATSCAHTVAEIDAALPATFLHELQHLINFSQHVVAHGADEEVGWLDEGLSIVAEELGSVYYEQKFPAPSGRTSPAQLFPDSSQGFIASLLPDSYDFLARPDTSAVTLHTDADDGTAWRGSDWLLLRWLGDTFGTAFYKKLEQSTRTGIANIEGAAGEPFTGLFSDFGVAVYTDSVPGLAKTAVPARYRFQSRTLRAMYQRLFANGAVSRAFPIAPTALRSTVTASMVPGTMSYYTITTTGSTPVTIKLTGLNGVALPTSLHPQLTIVRLP